jgi:hypothetical protein
MAIDDKPVEAWTESDLRELCEQRRPEGPRLEFKRELSLGNDGDKKEAARDTLGMANAGPGPGYVIYGIAEGRLEDGSTAAEQLAPLNDGALIERLNNVLDGRSDPPLAFLLHRIDAEQSGFYLVVEVHGRRRPHQATGGTYPVRRNLLVRTMTEAEVADAYRDRFRRDLLAVTTLQPPANELPPEATTRIHRGLKPGELSLYREERGEETNPGWFSVVVMPEPLQADLFDPIRVRDEDFRAVEVHPQWGPEQPLRHFVLQRSLAGLRAQLPPRDDLPPAYLIQVWPDGLMEFGTALEPALLHQDERDRVIPVVSIAAYAHDYTLFFVGALERAGYVGEVLIQYAFDDVESHTLGVDPGRAFAGEPKTLGVRSIEGPLWRGVIGGARDAVNRLVQTTMERLFLAGGMPDAVYFLTPDGDLIDRR